MLSKTSNGMKLDDPLRAHVRTQADQEKALKRLDIETVEDLLYHFPRSYGDTTAVRPIESLEPGQDAAVIGTISGLKTKKGWKSKVPMAEGTLRDQTGSMKIIWF